MEYQVDFGSTQNIKSPKYIIDAHQLASMVRVAKKANDIEVFDNLKVQKNHVDIDGVRYSRDGVSFNYASNDYVDQYRDFKWVYKEYVGGELINPSVIFTDMKNKCPI